MEERSSGLWTTFLTVVGDCGEHDNQGNLLLPGPCLEPTRSSDGDSADAVELMCILMRRGSNSVG